MATYWVEVYELHAQTVEVEAENEADAIAGALSGDGYQLNNRLDYIETADKYAGHVILSIDDANRLSDLGYSLTDNAQGIPGIRSINEV